MPENQQREAPNSFPALTYYRCISCPPVTFSGNRELEAKIFISASWRVLIEWFLGITTHSPVPKAVFILKQQLQEGRTRTEIQKELLQLLVVLPSLLQGRAKSCGRCCTSWVGVQHSLLVYSWPWVGCKGWSRGSSRNLPIVALLVSAGVELKLSFLCCNPWHQEAWRGQYKLLVM